ncbi:phage tail tube protein [Aurantimonas sp. 22II-16-19i]|uniref:phage tail tube protein n=1 Tax=Aurantimonas sp. 22II-16-19i TaxID=1317114 RepID=UPI0009F7CACF|nr:phage tail tube protein [Aurantimonas sp. 22II-16-19i]ORE85740.1 hypothetical protein ATO4_26252 [Aurantimonas sp. 22II-16-19i]
MATRKYRKLAALVKIETAYGVDATPTGAANAMLFSEVTFTPMEGQEVSRDLLLPYLGHQGVELTGLYARLQGSVEIAGSDDPGTAPAYGPLLRACGMAETVTTDTSVSYDPVSAGEEAASTYFNADGVNHVLLGVRGTFTTTQTPNQIPRFRFDLMGLLGTITDTALPTVDHTAFVRPVVVNKANTVMSLHGWTAITESISLDYGNQVEARFLIGAESMEITDRRATGTAVVEAKSLATKDWFAIAKARTRGALSVVHGTAAGNIVEFTAPQVEIGRPTQGQTQGILNYSLPLMLCHDTGDDELSIIVR